MSNPSSGPETFFTDDHRQADELWAQLEDAVDAGDDPRAARLWGELERSLRLHFLMEEEVLFPALEEAMGMHGGGPTQVMRMEHRQMLSVLEQMGRAAAAGDFAAVTDQGDTLLMLIQQHNVKEENILYPMAERTLGGAAWAPLAARLEAMYAAGR